MTSPACQEDDFGHKSQDEIQEDIDDEIKIVVQTLKTLQHEYPLALMEFMGYFSSWKSSDLKKCSKNRKGTPSRLRTSWEKSTFGLYFYVSPISGAHARNRDNGI